MHGSFIGNIAKRRNEYESRKYLYITCAIIARQ